MKTQTRDLKLLHVKVPRLTSKMVRIGADLPRLTCEKATLIEVVESVEIAAPVAPAIIEREPERTAGKGPVSRKDAPVAPVAIEQKPEPATKGLRDVSVKVIPTPKKRHSRTEEVAVEPVVPDEPRPLKVIRRRREEEPKVFETTARLFPKAMLEGVKSPPDQNGESLSK